MSSKTRSHGVVCGFREAKMESSACEGGGYLQGVARAVSRRMGQD